MEGADLLAGMDPVDPLVMMNLEEATAAAAAVTVMMRMNLDTKEGIEMPSSYNPQRSSIPQAEHPSENGSSRQTFGSKLQESGTKTESLKPSYYWMDMHSHGG
jgi:hypothetical protein